MSNGIILKIESIIYGLFTLVLLSCTNEHSENNKFTSGPWQVWLESVNDSTNIVRLSVDGVSADSLLLPFPVYRLDGGDLDGDGIPEICIGVVKSTKYWKDAARRLFIYRLYHGKYLRPLWLGSRVGHRLEDFRVDRTSSPAIVLTDELLNDSVVIHQKYTLRGFGLRILNEELQ